MKFSQFVWMKGIPATWSTSIWQPLAVKVRRKLSTPQTPTLHPALIARKSSRQSLIVKSPANQAMHYIHLPSRRNPNATQFTTNKPTHIPVQKGNQRQWLAQGGGAELPIIRPNIYPYINFYFFHVLFDMRTNFLLARPHPSFCGVALGS